MALGHHLWTVAGAPSRTRPTRCTPRIPRTDDMERIVSRSVIVVVGVAATLAASTPRRPAPASRGPDDPAVHHGPRRCRGCPGRGVYRFNGKSIAAEGIGWDALSRCSLWCPRCCSRCRTCGAGPSAHCCSRPGSWPTSSTSHFEYAMALAYGPLFAVYVRDGCGEPDAASLCSWPELDTDQLRARITIGFPRRPMIGFGMFMAVLLGGMWLAADRHDVRRDIGPPAERWDHARRPGFRPRPARAARPVHGGDRPTRSRRRLTSCRRSWS